MYLGLFELGTTVRHAIPITVLGEPVDPVVNPTYRIYEDNALIANGTGSLTKLDTGDITGATNASPIEITTDGDHGLETGNIVTISNVGGNTAANGTFQITKTATNKFTLNGSTGNASYTSGGAWHVAGVYQLELELLSGSGFDIGKTYQVVIGYTVSSTAYVMTAYFAVT